jgi:alanine dehydrogenase
LVAPSHRVTGQGVGPMLIGVPTEVVPGEKRVALTPEGARRLIEAGHRVLLESGAGEGSGYPDEVYAGHDVEVVVTADEVWARADLVTKVKQPLEEETPRFREGLILFGYCHLATRPWLVDALLEKRVTAVAFEEVVLPDGERPLLRPMSEIAGRLAILVAAQYLAEPYGHRGVLLGTVSGRSSAGVLIIGGGTAGVSAAAAACGLGAAVTVVDRDPERARARVAKAAPSANVLAAPATPELVQDMLPDIDVVVNAVLWDPLTGQHLVTRDSLRGMREGAVIVDVDCTPGGVIETTRVTTIEEPTFEVEGVIHYCVPNMPATVPHTSTEALTSATLPYLERLADLGVIAALETCPELAAAVVCRNGKLLDSHVAAAQGRPTEEMDH